MPQLDALVVGAGPAGSWTAYRLARGGARVAILDPSHPREKPCGGGITGRALALIAPALGQSLAAVEITAAGFSYAGRSSRVELNEDASGYPPLVVAGRRELDGALLAAAVAAGADHRPLRATEVRHDGTRWVVETRHGEETASWLVGADGANSLVRRRVSRRFSRADLSIAAGYFVHGVSSREIAVAFEDEPPGYLWSFPRPDHLAVGICAQADESSAGPLLERARRWLAGQAATYRSLERYGWPIPSLTERTLSAERPAGAGWMLVGDAAGLVDPITREGIYFALRSADLAAGSLLNGTNAAADYVERVRKEIFSELSRAAHLRARFFQPHFMGLLVAGLARSARIRAVMADLVAGRQTYHGLRRRLLRTLEWKLMAGLFGGDRLQSSPAGKKEQTWDSGFPN
jgi:geranylgeranyl reductase family protein